MLAVGTVDCTWSALLSMLLFTVLACWGKGCAGFRARVFGYRPGGKLDPTR